MMQHGSEALVCSGGEAGMNSASDSFYKLDTDKPLVNKKHSLSN